MQILRQLERALSLSPNLHQPSADSDIGAAACSTFVAGHPPERLTLRIQALPLQRFRLGKWPCSPAWCACRKPIPCVWAGVSSRQQRTAVKEITGGMYSGLNLNSPEICPTLVPYPRPQQLIQLTSHLQVVSQVAALTNVGQNTAAVFCCALSSLDMYNPRCC